MNGRVLGVPGQQPLRQRGSINARLAQHLLAAKRGLRKLDGAPLLALVAFALTAAAAIPGFASTVDPVPPSGSPGRLSIAVGAYASTPELRIDFLKVLSDDRCPEGTTCVSAGNAATQIRVTELSEVNPGPNAPAPAAVVVVLNSLVQPTAIVVGAWRVSFAGLSPLKAAKRTLDPASYKLTVGLARLGEGLPSTHAAGQQAKAPAVASIPAPLAPATAVPAPAARVVAASPATATLVLTKGVARSWQGLQIEFREVTEDSRCPAGVQCVWAGNARVQVRVSGAGVSPSPSDFLINSNQGPTSAKIGATTLHFVSLAPAPLAPALSTPAPLRPTDKPVLVLRAETGPIQD